ncbi:MAG: tetratricopeptide (TPR) repeat protein [Oceanicoccus sp.]|jgi:tetratricopeptide (TPR) repeat protein
MLLGILIGLLTACSGTPIQETAAVVISDTAPETEVEVVETPDRPFPADSLYDLLVAEFAVRRNRYDLALGNYLQQAHQTQDPGVTARATRLAQFLRADKATLDAAQLWVDLEPENSEAQYTLATMLAKNKRPLEAMTHMTRVLENGGSTNFAAIAASALPLPETSRYAIEQEIEQLLLQYPGNTQLLTSKSLLYQQRGEIKQALAIIRQVLLIDDSELHAVIVEARLLQQLNRDEEAFQRLETVVAQHPNNRRLRLQYARMLMRKDITLAKLQFEILLAAAPNDADLLLSLGLISKESNQIEDAQRYFKHLLAGGQRENEANYYLAQLAEQREDWPSAIAYYQQIPPGSDFLAAVNRIKTLYMKQGRDDTAREYLQSQRQRYPEHSVRLYLLESEMLLTSGDIDGSHKLLTEALLITPNQASLLYARSMTAEKLGLIELMEKDLRNIIAQDENNATALNALGYVLANRTDRYDEAYELVSRALQTKPGDPAILDSLGWIEYRRGNLQRAHEILLQAYKAFPDPEVAAHLGEVLWQLGQQQQAIKIWQQGLAKNPDSSFINEAMQRLLPDEAVPDPASQSLIEKAE